MTEPKNGPVGAPDNTPTNTLAPVELLVCTTCRRSNATDQAPDITGNAEAPRPGALLHSALTRAGLPEGVELRAVECLSNCDHGCSIVLRGGEARWTYVYANLDERDHVDTIVDGVSRYHATTDGLVPWRERSQHFRKNCVARIPPIGEPL